MTSETSPFYSTPERIVALEEAALSWLGTPFAGNSAVKGPQGGVCCHRLVHCVLMESGWGAIAEVPSAPSALAWRTSEGVMLDWLRGRPDLLREYLPGGVEPVAGDIVVYQIGMCAHHMGLILTQDRLLHAWRRGGAQLSHARDRQLASRAIALFRPMEVHHGR
jgi:hypothetical protein